MTGSDDIFGTIEKRQRERRTRAEQSQLVDLAADATEPPHLRFDWFRRIKEIKTLGPLVSPEVVSLAVARRLAEEAVDKYLATPHPDHKLVLKLPAGAGKSHILVHVAARLARAGKTVLYLVPRHDMFPELQLMANPGDRHLFIEWLPKQAETDTKQETCKYPVPIQKWTEKGYEPIKFCGFVKGCGFEFIQNGCVWHAQARRVREMHGAVIVGQHQHLFVGHPLSNIVSVVIGDESPLNAVQADWNIPYGSIVPKHLPVPYAFRMVLREIFALAEAGNTLTGDALIRLLVSKIGSIETLRAVCDAVPQMGTPKMSLRPEGVALLDYNHAYTLAQMLVREIDLFSSGKPYPERISVGRWIGTDGVESIQAITMVRRHHVMYRPDNDPDAHGFPRHMIWADATAAKDFYELIFEKPVEMVEVHVPVHRRIFQVHSRGNGITAMFDGDDPTKGARELIAQMAHIAGHAKAQGRLVGIITHKKLAAMDEVRSLASIGWNGKPMVGHFGGERGSNEFSGVDTLIIGGIGQQKAEDLHLLARAVHYSRDEAFELGTVNETRPYNFTSPDGKSYGIEVRTHTDPDIAALHWQGRDGEQIQAVNRDRAVTREPGNPVDVWLLHNVPIDALPPDYLISLQELMGSIPGADTFLYPKVRAYMQARRLAGASMVEANDVVEATGVSKKTAIEYLNRLVEDDLDEDGEPYWRHPEPGEVVLVRGPLRGRPPFALMPTRRH